MVAISSRPPGVSVMRFSMTSPTTLIGRPLSRATRSRQGWLEGDLAVHRAGRDRGDLVLQADFGGKFVDAFLADHGGIHIGDQQFLAARLGILDDDDRSGHRR
jgi:hypothetical protein